ncbi:hypothetical protein Tco_1421417 [Tanacetum coccineum]
MLGITLEYLRIDVYRSVWVVEKLLWIWLGALCEPVVTQQESQTNKSKNVLSSTRMNATSSVKRSKSRYSHVKTSVLDVSKNEAKKEAVYVRQNKQTDNTFANVVSNKDNVIDVAATNASKAKTLLCVSFIIMAQQQHADELCPPNKRYDLMDANKKVDLKHVQCPSKSKILMNIIKNHPLRFSIAASAFLPWIYMAQFWHTLKEDGSNHRLKFLLDRKDLTLTLDDFRTIFHLP